MGTGQNMNSGNDDVNDAVIPRVVKEIYRRIKNEKESDFRMTVSFVEVIRLMRL